MKLTIKTLKNLGRITTLGIALLAVTAAQAGPPSPTPRAPKTAEEFDRAITHAHTMKDQILNEMKRPRLQKEELEAAKETLAELTREIAHLEQGRNTIGKSVSDVKRKPGFSQVGSADKNASDTKSVSGQR